MLYATLNSLSIAKTSKMIIFFNVIYCNTDLFLIQDTVIIATDWGCFSPNDVYGTQIMHVQFNVTYMFSFKVPLNLTWFIVQIVIY